MSASGSPAIELNAETQSPHPPNAHSPQITQITQIAPHPPNKTQSRKGAKPTRSPTVNQNVRAAGAKGPAYPFGPIARSPQITRIDPDRTAYPSRKHKDTKTQRHEDTWPKDDGRDLAV